MPPVLSVTELVDLGEYAPEESILGVGVGVDGTVVAVLAAEGSTDPSNPLAARALFLADGAPLRMRFEPLSLRRWVLPQPMADGGLLLIERRREDRSPNATVIGPDGTTTGRFEVGDGVEDAVIDAQGRLWVSYFDEGTTGGDPLSKNGLSRFDADSGMPDWVYPQGSDWLVDCYALNVTGQEAWAYGYGSFGRESHRLIHVLEDGNVRQFEPGMKPAFGLLVYEERIVFVGFDVLGRPTAVVSEREGSRVGLTRPLEIRTSAKLRWRDRPRMVGRGDRLYFVIGAVCWVASLEG